MKKITLLLLLPLTALVAIDFTMTKEGLFTETTVESPIPAPTPGTDPKVDNPYLEPVNLPKCDASNPEVQFIRSNADWSKINSSSKRIFCVSPGDYRSIGSVKLTKSGTATKRRYIVLNNGNNTHPGKLNTNELATFDLLIDGADYWTIDRYYANRSGGSDTQGGYNVRLKNGASFNIFNRMYMTHFGAMTIFNLCHNNTIQNSRFSNQNDPGYDGSVALQIAPWGAKDAQVHNTKVINNEFYNCNDGFQIVRMPVSGYKTSYQDLNVEGTIVDSNLFHKDVPYMENAIDIKAGSDNPSNPVIISNNKMWGYTRHPDYVPGQYPPGKWAIVAHYSPKNIHIIDNIIFDSDVGLATGSNGPSSGFDKGLIDSKVQGNLFYNCGSTDRSEYAIRFSSTRGTDISNNVIINGEYAYGTFGNNGSSGNKSYFRNNEICDIPNVYKDTGGNQFDFVQELSTNTECERTLNKDYEFIADVFTNNPRVIRLKNAI